MQTRQRAATPLARSVRPERRGARASAGVPVDSALPGDAPKPPLVAASLLHRAAASRHHPHG